MKILVCYKWVLDEQDIKIVPDTLALDAGRAKGKISDYDKHAIEAAMQLADAADVDVLTFGTKTAKKSLKDVLSRGPGKAFYIMDDAFDKADACVTANVLAAAIKKIGSYDLILCGEGSSDAYNEQITSRLAALLQITAVPFAEQMEPSGAYVRVVRKLDDSRESMTITGPAVVSVLPGINKPRIPSLKEVLAASKKPSNELKLAELGLDEAMLAPKTVRISTKGFVMNRKNIVYKASDAAENVKAFVAALKQEGVI